MENHHLLRLTLAAILIFSSRGHAVTLAYYDFSGLSATTVRSGSNASNLALDSPWSVAGGTGNSNIDQIGLNGNVQAISFNFTVGGLGAGESITIDRFAVDLAGKYHNTGSRYSLTIAVNGNAGRNDEFDDWGSSATFDKVPGGGSTASGDIDPAAITGLVNGNFVNVRFSLGDTVDSGSDRLEPKASAIGSDRSLFRGSAIMEGSRKSPRASSDLADSARDIHPASTRTDPQLHPSNPYLQ